MQMCHVYWFSATSDGKTECMCAAAVPYKNGFRNFSQPQRNYKTRWKKEHGCDNYYANHRRPPSPTRKRELSWISRLDREQQPQSMLWKSIVGLAFYRVFCMICSGYCSHHCTKQLFCTNLKQCVKICYTLRKLDKSRNLTHLTHRITYRHTHTYSHTNTHSHRIVPPHIVILSSLLFAMVNNA